MIDAARVVVPIYLFAAVKEAAAIAAHDDGHRAFMQWRIDVSSGRPVLGWTVPKAMQDTSLEPVP